MKSEIIRRPIVAFWLSLIGGISALLIGFYRFLSFLGPSLPIIPLFFIVYGIILIVSSSEMYRHPKKHRALGIVILILSIEVGFLHAFQVLIFPRFATVDLSIEILVAIVGSLGGISLIVQNPTSTLS